MGERVDAAQNEVVAVENIDHATGRNIGAPEAIFCTNCGDMGGAEFTNEETGYSGTTSPQGYAPVADAEEQWIEVDGQLCCGVYCAAKVAGLSEKQAQLARGMKTRMEMRKAGFGELADLDEQHIQAILDGEAQSVPFEHVADEDTHDIDTTPDNEGANELSAEFEEILRQMGDAPSEAKEEDS